MREGAFDTVDEDARRRFESAWASGQPEPIERFLPPAGNSNYAATLLELVLIELEMAWKARSSAGVKGPRAEDFVSRFPALNDPDLLSRLVQEEYLIRQRHGENPVLAEFQARFPDLNWTAIAFDTAIAPPRSADPELPNIPGLEIQGILGRGGMGVVYKACQTELDRTVAVKQILSSSGVLTADDLSRFRNEAQAVARLRHPNIVQVHEVGQERGRPYLILEFVDGGTLAKRLAATPQPARAAAEMMRCLARAVQAVHDAGLLHRDLKPGNVLLSLDGTLKITDFGLTKRVADNEAGAAPLTESGAIMGTPSYMAPEQASGRNREVGPAADIYSLGAILYEMLVGFPPFRGETPMETVMQVVSQEPVPPRRLQPRTPRDLETICLKCLEKDPRNRYVSAASLADDLDCFLAGESIRARPVGAVERGWRWCRRKPALAALVLLLALVGIGGAAGWFVWRDVENRRELQSADETRKKTEAEARRRDQARAAAESNRDRAMVELREGRFDSAREFLRRAHDQLAAEPAADELAAAIAQQFSRADRLATFYHQADRAERMAFVEVDQSALQSCDVGLKAIGVFDKADSWWTRLPAEDLRPEQAAKLTRDVDHQLMLFAALGLKEGQDAGAKSDAAKTRQTVLDALKLGENYRDARQLPPSVAGRILESYIHASQFRFDKIRRLAGQEPENASDCYFVGMALFWMAQQPDDWISKAVGLTFPLLGIKIGEPKATAERLLRRAVAEEPGHYWSHFWLGWCLVAQKDYAGAELSFTSCTSLRPEEGLAYAERARVLAFSAVAKEASIRDGLARRVAADAERANRYSPHDWYVQVPLLHANIALGQQKELNAAAGRLLERITLPHLLPVRAREEQESILKEALPYLDVKDPIEPAETHSVLALANVFLKNDAEAMRRADLAAKASPDHPRVHIVRGILHLRKKELPDAIRFFRAALVSQPQSFLALAGLSRAQELSGDFHAALRGYQDLLAVAASDGQRLAARMGAYRNLTHLGRADEAQKEFAYALAIDPKVIPLPR